MTDGHSSRYGELVHVANQENNCEPLIRLAQSSAVTQMLDQIFHRFHAAYVKGATAIARAYEGSVAARDGSIHDLYKCTKQTVVVIVSRLHEGGTCSWITAWEIISAWAKVGFTIVGMDVNLLISNPKIIQSAPPPPSELRSLSAAFDNPDKLKEGTKKYLEAKCLHFEKLSAQLRTDPETVQEIVLQCAAPTATPEQAAFASKWKVDLDREPSSRKVHTDAINEDKDWYRVTGLIGRNVKCCEGRAASKKKADDAKKKKASKSAEAINLKTQYHLCRRGVCTCGCDPCVAVDYAYCYMCEQKGRIYMKRTACVNKSCVAQRAAMPNLAAPPPPPHAPPSPALPPAAAVAPANPAGFVLQPGPVAPSALTGSS
jgi:hypothetical protein